MKYFNVRTPHYSGGRGSYWYIFIEIISKEWTELATDFTTTINTMSCFIMVPPYSGKY